MDFKTKLRQLRTEQKMTQQDLAEKLFVTPQAISRWENGDVEPSLTMLSTIAKLFNVSVDELFGGDTKNAEAISGTPATKEVVYVERVTKPVLAVCESCNKPIYEPQDIVRGSRRRGRSYTDFVICHTCDEEQREKAHANAVFQANARRVKSYWFGGLAAAVVLAIGLAITISMRDPVAITVASVIGLLFFPFVSCIVLDNNFIMEMSATVFDWGIVKMPGLIFSLDLDGIIWFLTVKLALMIISFIVGAAFFLAGISLGLALSVFVYPFALRKSIINPESTNE